MLNRVRPTKLSIAALCLVGIAATRAMTAPTPTDPCAAEAAAYVAAYDALQAARQDELDAQYAVQQAESALEAAYNAMVACEGEATEEEEYTPSAERQALLDSMQSVLDR